MLQVTQLLSDRALHLDPNTRLFSCDRLSCFQPEGVSGTLGNCYFLTKAVAERKRQPALNFGVVLLLVYCLL